MIARQPELTYSEYLAYEQSSPKKHEFVNGQAFAMAEEDENHNLIVINLVGCIHPHLRGTGSRLLALAMKLTIASANNATYYPDVMVVCDRSDNDPYVKQKPCLLIEVLSPFTAMLDRREKLFNYQKLESLQEYVMVSQTEIKVELYRRDPEGWLVQSLSIGESLQLQSIDLAIALSDIYEDVQL
ncbi:Uma2 family endonuclease [Pseudanabaena yagii]|uniref:Uma2 family endonuclease n=1 Tax=Pseudanabaena yagii GIHE-NHR1 TaxID=2722753 RepID=A0ABX1LY21_9CYAN|nr:Uma2 family endonuclease [Pseudanabaena yagii]NMF61115.1 Uma2 family endonuclease [Pseudanabaena yagii GIHE-NHR1]